MTPVSPEVSQLLAQMRVMSAQAQGAAVTPQAEVQPSVNFSDVLKNSIDSVNELQQTSNQLKTAFTQGDPNVSITEVMIASQKSSLAFTAMTEVRNKLVEAYKDVMSMPV